MGYFDDVFITFMDVNSDTSIDLQWRNRKLSE